jgi:hypothetical protein
MHYGLAESHVSLILAIVPSCVISITCEINIGTNVDVQYYVKSSKKVRIF